MDKRIIKSAEEIIADSQRFAVEMEKLKQSKATAFVKKEKSGFGLTKRMTDQEIRIEDILEESKALLKNLEKETGQKQVSDVDKILAESRALLKETGKTTRAVRKSVPSKKLPKSEREVHNGKGYTYIYAETGELILKARAIMEKRIGRPLHDWERVLYRDGDRKNCAEDNLILAYKSGVPLDFLTCSVCGARGNWTVQEKEYETPNTSHPSSAEQLQLPVTDQQIDQAPDQ